jgi:hypothetical protein
LDGDWIRSTSRRFGINGRAGVRAEFAAFKQRVMNVLHDVACSINAEGVRQFCQVVSIPIPSKQGLVGPIPDSSIVLTTLSDEHDIQHFLFLLQVVLELPIDNVQLLTRPSEGAHDALLRGIQEAIDMSRLDIELTITKRGAILRPRGEPSLEKPLVHETMGTLKGTALAHFSAALASYGKRTKADRIKSAESLRRCLEEFLRDRMANSKGLDANIKALLSKLKQDGRDSSIRSIIHQTFNLLDQYYNENSKHADGEIDLGENEYLIYQTGVLVRFVSRALKAAAGESPGSRPIPSRDIK